MAIRRFDPFGDLMDLQRRVNRLFEESSRGEREVITEKGWSPPVDIFEQPDAILIEVDLPGLTKSELTVTVQNNVLTIEGERKIAFEDSLEKYHIIERLHGSFTRSFTIPANIEVGKIEAEFDNGVLRIQLPKREEAKPTHIEVKVG